MAGLAYRLPVYGGMMQLRIEQQDKAARRNVRSGRGKSMAQEDVKMVDSTKAAILADPLLAGAIDFG